MRSNLLVTGRERRSLRPPEKRAWTLSGIVRSVVGGLGGNWALRRGDSDRTWAGESAEPDSALQLATAWACVRLNARTVGALPRALFIGKKGSAARKAAYDHVLYRILHDSPNADQTAMEFWEGMATCLNLRGNGYAEKDVGMASGKLVGLTPFPVDDVRVFRDQDGRRRYKISGSGSRYNDLGEDRVFHLRGFGAGGLAGLSPLEYGRQTVAGSLAADRSAAGTFKSGLQLAGFIEMETGVKLKDGQREDLVAMFEKFSASGKPGKFMPLDPGMSFAPLAMKPSDAQLLETRSFNIEEICRWFGTPPILIGHAPKGQTMFGSGVEQVMLAWLALFLGSELERIEQAIEKQLLTAAEKVDMFVEHNVDALLRSDSSGRAAIMSVQAQNGLRTRNELRAKENMPAMPGGDVLTVQSNLMPLDKLGAGGGEQNARSAMANWLLGGDPAEVIGAAVAAALKSYTPTSPAAAPPPAEE